MPEIDLDALTFRPLTEAELKTSVDWAAAEGWNPGLHDAEVFWRTDPEGYIGAELDGELVATGSIVSYGGRYGFMGLFIVRSDLRGSGIGTRLWFHRRDTLLKRLESGAAIGMDGVFEMQDWYAKGGFKFSHRNLRMQGKGAASEAPAAGVVPLAEVDAGELADFDTTHFGVPRPSFLAAWRELPDSRGRGFVENGRLRGYGVIRRCREGHKIGPLFAQTPEVAEALFVALSATAAGEAIWLDIPENNPAAVALAERHGLTEVFGCARMYHGEPPAMPWSEIYGVTTFELG